MGLTDVEHTIERACILFQELALCCRTDEQFAQDMATFMIAAQRVLDIVQKTTGLPREACIDIALEIFRNRDKAKSFVLDHARAFAS